MLDYARTNPFLTFLILLCVIIACENVLVAFADSINRKEPQKEETEETEESDENG